MVESACLAFSCQGLVNAGCCFWEWLLLEITGLLTEEDGEFNADLTDPEQFRAYAKNTTSLHVVLDVSTANDSCLIH